MDAASSPSDSGVNRPAVAPSGYHHSLQAQFSGPVNADTRVDFLNVINRRAGEKSGLGMVVDPINGVPVYRWESGSHVGVSGFGRQPNVQASNPLPASSVGHATTLPILPNMQGPPSDSAHSSVSLASGSVKQVEPIVQVPSRHALPKGPTIASWTKEAPVAVPVRSILTGPSSQHTPFARVSVNLQSPCYALPLRHRQIAPSMRMAKNVESLATVPQWMDQTQPSPSTISLAHKTSSSTSSSLSATPSIRIPKDAIHGRATQVEILSGPYFAEQYGKRPITGSSSASSAPAAHPGLQAGRYMAPTFPPFPTFPAFPACPAFPAFPKFPDFPAVSRGLQRPSAALIPCLDRDRLILLMAD